MKIDIRNTVDGGAGIDYHPVFNRRMSFGFGHCLIYTQCAQGNPLVHLYVFTDLDRFPDYYTGTMIYAEVAPDPGRGMNVNASLTMSIFAQDTGNQGHT